mmetsp:Transcript_2187/g.4008  ORF Transcript_2187/g.4008 Transcript_2187/m.4008 type:complete len:368 (-) Transcript_2187:750-1853(-)
MATTHRRLCGIWVVLVVYPWLVPQVLGQSVYGPDYVPPNPKHTLPVWLDPPKFAKVASCVVDVSTSMIFLGHAGSSLNAAVKTCKPQNYTAKESIGERRASCTASISGVVLGFTYAAGFLSRAAADCKSSLQVVDIEAVKKAACAADIATFAASLALLGNSAASASNTCQGNIPTSLNRMADNTRRLYDTAATQDRDAAPVANDQIKQEQLEGLLSHHIDSPFEANNITLRERSGEIAMCFFDVGQATFMLAQAGLELNSAVADCSRFALRTGGKHALARCETDVRRVISSFAFVASGISYATFHCPFWKTAAPACTGAIGNLIAALAEIAAVSSSFHATCGHMERRDISKLKPPPRRLAGEGHLFV